MDLGGTILGSGLTKATLSFWLKRVLLDTEIKLWGTSVFCAFIRLVNVHKFTVDLEKLYRARGLALNFYRVNKQLFGQVIPFFKSLEFKQKMSRGTDSGFLRDLPIFIDPKDQFCIDRGFKYPTHADYLNQVNRQFFYRSLCLLGLRSIINKYLEINVEYNKEVLFNSFISRLIFFEQIVVAVFQKGLHQLNRIF